MRNHYGRLAYVTGLCGVLVAIGCDSPSATEDAGGRRTRDAGRMRRDAAVPSSDGGMDPNPTDDDAGSRPRRDAGTPTTPTPTRTTGCGNSSARRDAWNFSSGGRTAVIAAPNGYNRDTAYPVVIAYHGGGDNGPSFRGWSGVENAAGGGAIFIYPSGPDGIWHGEVYDADFRFVRAALDAVFEEYCADSSAVFAYGFSWGGWAATQMACEARDAVRGVASIGGGGPFGNPTCDGPVPVMLIHGRGDEAEHISSSEMSRTEFRGVNGCSNTEESFSPSPCAAYAGCDEPLVWCWHNGAHEIPSFAPGAIWSFFQSLR